MIRGESLRGEADALNWLWDWSTVRMLQNNHPYYAMLAQDMRALVRSYGARETRS